APAWAAWAIRGVTGGGGPSPPRRPRRCSTIDRVGADAHAVALQHGVWPLGAAVLRRNEQRAQLAVRRLRISRKNSSAMRDASKATLSSPILPLARFATRICPRPITLDMRTFLVAWTITPRMATTERNARN